MIAPTRGPCDTSLSSLMNEPSRKQESQNVQTPLRRSMWLDSWSFEWITLVFSIGCFAAIVFVLWRYDGKVRPDMAQDLSLNTIVSVLATGCKSTLVLVITKAITQLKWLTSYGFEIPNRIRVSSLLVYSGLMLRVEGHLVH